MNWEAIGAIGEVVGAIAVVATLIYLAAQVRQGKEATDANTQSLKLQSYQSWQAANLQLNTAMADPVQSALIQKGSKDPRDLTEENWLGFGMMYIGMFQMAQSTDYLYRSGALDRELWEAEMNRMAGILSFSGVRQLWDAGVKRHLTPSFVEHIESMDTDIVALGWSEEKGFFEDTSYQIVKTEENQSGFC